MSESKDPNEIPGQRYWFYHPESESYITATRDEMVASNQSGLLDELGPATTEDQAEAKRLHEELVREQQQFRKRV